MLAGWIRYSEARLMAMRGGNFLDCTMINDEAPIGFFLPWFVGVSFFWASERIGYDGRIHASCAKAMHHGHSTCDAQARCQDRAPL